MTGLDGVEIGDRLEPLQPGAISRTTLALFAGASGDHNPIHIDLDVARSAGLQDVFVHGMLSMAYLGRLLTDNVPQQSLRSFRVRFSAITPIHGAPTCTADVTGVDDGRAHLALGITLPDATTTLTGDAVVDLS